MEKSYPVQAHENSAGSHQQPVAGAGKQNFPLKDNDEYEKEARCQQAPQRRNVDCRQGDELCEKARPGKQDVGQMQAEKTFAFFIHTKQGIRLITAPAQRRL